MMVTRARGRGSGVVVQWMENLLYKINKFETCSVQHSSPVLCTLHFSREEISC